MASKAVRTAIIGILVVGGLGIGIARVRAGAKAKTDVGRTAVAALDDIVIKVSENGTLEPVTKVDVKSRVAGRLLKIYVRPGDQVTAGAPLATVDPTEVSRDVATAQAQLLASQAGLEQAQMNFVMTQKTTALSVQRAEVNLQNAKVGLKDAEVSLKDAVVGLKDAEIGLEDAKMAVTQSEKRLTQAAAPSRSQEVQQARQTIRRTEAQLVDAKRTLARRQSLVSDGFLSRQDVDSAQTQVSLVEADLESAKERLALLEEGPRKEDIDVSQVGVSSSKIGVDRAQSTLNRARVRVEQAQVRVEQARVAVRTAEVGLATERANSTQTKVRAQDVARSQSDVSQVENRLAQQSVQLKETRIIAPIAGEVTGKYLEEGELVASATSGFAQGAAIITIADLSRMQVRVNVNEVDVARLRAGLPVKIRVDGIPSTDFAGKVVAIAPASLTSTQPGQTNSNTSGNNAGVVRFEVKIAVENKDKRLRPGMTAAVDIILDRHEKTLVLPTEALRPGDKVMVVSGTGETQTKAERAVKVGLRDDAHVEILSGLKAGEKVEIAPPDAKDRRKVEFDGPN